MPGAWGRGEPHRRALPRRCGCRAVPYGVYLNSKGEYVPFDENLTTDELAKIFEL